MKDILKQKAVKVDNVFVKEMPDSAVALNLNNENYYGLNTTAFVMYENLLTSDTVADALVKLTEEFEADPEEIKKDLISLIKELLEEGMIKLTEDQSL